MWRLTIESDLKLDYKEGFLVVYLMFLDHAIAIWLLFGAGFFTVAAYILMITLARHALGFGLGRRMGFIVGGTWAFADIVFLGLLPIAQHFGSDFVLKFSPIGYIISALFGLYILKNKKGSGAFLGSAARVHS